MRILATLGPSSMKESTVRQMDAAGVDVFRINLSHVEIGDLERTVKDIQSWTKKPICIDTEGAQIRTGKMGSGAAVLKNNDIVALTAADVPGNEFSLPFYPINPSEQLRLGDVISIDYHAAVVQVIQIEKEKVSARVLFGGEVRSNKGATIDRPIALPSFTEKDLKAIELTKTMGLDNFALSFAAKKEDVEKLRSFFPNYPVFVTSKIESKLGLANLKDICRSSDAILIDRGDLSRDVPLQKIGLTQRYILDVAKESNTPVYVATNLLESMMQSFQPTRAEINDITSTLLSGAAGLVLAAETAIGRYPVESARMVATIMQEVKNSSGRNYFDSLYDYNLIEPHGGVLVQNFIEPDKVTDLTSLPKIEVDDKTLLDVVQIAEGTYSPLRGFMNKEELFSVLNHYKLPSGVVWTLPILLQTTNPDQSLVGRTAAISHGQTYAIMKVAAVEKIDLVDVAQRWFGTTDTNHPGVASFKEKGDYIISGEIWLMQRPFLSGQSHILTPRQTRAIFKDFGWQKIVGFHTRNVIHRGHEFIQKAALDLVGADALFVSPVIGPKKETDFSAEAILKAYEVMLKNNYYNPYPALIGAFNTYSRYSGPREAIFTALCRKNFGCSHFIVGRDHTGVGNYYPADASQKLFEKLAPGLGIQPVMFEAAYFCQACGQVTNNCSHTKEQRLDLSGTKIRRTLLASQNIPDYLVRVEVAKALIELRDSGDKLFEKDN